MTLPLPMNLDVQLIGVLQSSSSWACSMALDALTVPNFRLANVIEVRDRQLFVEEACSGIGSMFALLAAASLLLLVNGRSLMVSAITLFSVPVWAMLGNFVRLLAIALAQHIYERDLSHGTDHEILGMATFLLAAGGLWMTEWFVANLLQPMPPSAPEAAFMIQTVNALIGWPNPDPFANNVDAEHHSPQERAAREAKIAAELARKEEAKVKVQPTSLKPVRITIQAAAIIGLLVSLAPLVLLLRGRPSDIFAYNLPAFDESQLAKFPGPESMPEQLGEWKRVAFRPETRSSAIFFGAHSRIWDYRNNANEFKLSMDFPFRGSHPLEVCYRSTGWKIDKIESKTVDDEEWPWTELRMRNDFGVAAIVCYATLTEEGMPFVTKEETLLAGKPSHGIVAALSSPSSLFQPICYQVQLLCEVREKLSDEELVDIRKQFLAARKDILAKVAALREAIK